MIDWPFFNQLAKSNPAHGMCIALLFSFTNEGIQMSKNGFFSETGPSEEKLAMGSALFEASIATELSNALLEILHSSDVEPSIALLRTVAAELYKSTEETHTCLLKAHELRAVK